MSSFESELSELLEKECTLLNNLEVCAEEKSDILASGDLDALSGMLDRERPMVLQCKAVETKRIDLLRKNKLFDKTLREICEAADPDSKKVLSSQLENLTDVTKKLKDRNDLNNELTKTRLEFYGKMRSVLVKPAYGYDKEPKKGDQTDASFIDRKI